MLVFGCVQSRHIGACVLVLAMPCPCDSWYARPKAHGSTPTADANRTSLQCSCLRSLSTTLSTARPPALHTGLPPYLHTTPGREAGVTRVRHTSEAQHHTLHHDFTAGGGPQADL